MFMSTSLAVTVIHSATIEKNGQVRLYVCRGISPGRSPGHLVVELAVWDSILHSGPVLFEFLSRPGARRSRRSLCPVARGRESDGGGWAGRRGQPNQYFPERF